ncbi:uncharacterized protein TA18235 [Theileria annulata]|uniref:Uncharacterized protein n=1 Tax=Theileria annulata TaxID=5874 RepID=Q4UB06_THEAN|nr:uncharacterized protein TA18235 [Theileria annulata]CAI75995.1 hypothetical protein TA18235 [Theileria annulata]|eukprot:XP_955471.1 hypothetical protein TA18235 [Theileria annulata]
MDSAENPKLFSGKNPGDVKKLDIINVKKFLQSRAQEIEEVFTLLKQNDKQKRIFQKLPFVMRRRAMSHNPFKIPRNIRAHILKEMAKNTPKIELLDTVQLLNLKQVSKRIRKDRRRKLNRLQEYQQRCSRNKWLETHLYHAKRFKMDSVWGYRLAITPTQKSKRRFLRHLKHKCVIHDRSYVEVISVSGELEQMKKTFKLVFSDSFFMFQDIYTCGDTRGTSFCYSDYNSESDDNPDQNTLRNLIAPVNYIWLPTKGQIRTIWLFVHPISKLELYNTLLKDENLKVENVDNLVKFELFGPLSMLLLKKALKVDPNYSLSNKLWSSISVNTSTGSPLHSINCHSFVLPISITIPQVFGTRIPFDLSKATCLNEELKVELPLNEQEKEDLNTERLKFYHYKSENKPLQGNPLPRNRKRKDYSKLIDKLLDSLTHPTTTKIEYKNEIKDEEEDQNISLPKIPILAIFRNSDPCGVDLLIPPNSNSNKLWILLNRFGGLSIGLTERRHLMNHFHLPSFPHDFPETELGQLYYKNLFKTESNKYAMRPANKRVNYSFLGVDNAFVLPVNLEEQKVNFSPELTTPHLKTTQQCLFKSRHLLLTSLCSGLYHEPAEKSLRVLRLSYFSNNSHNLHIESLLKRLTNGKNWGELEISNDEYVSVILECSKSSLNFLTRLYQIEANDLNTVDSEVLKSIFMRKNQEVRGYMRVKEPFHREYKMSSLKSMLQAKNPKNLNQAVIQSTLDYLNHQGMVNSRKLMGFTTSKGKIFYS